MVKAFAFADFLQAILHSPEVGVVDEIGIVYSVSMYGPELLPLVDCQGEF